MNHPRPHLTVLSLYTLLTFVLTWPWVRHFGTAFPGSATWAFDESTFIWNIWRFKHNILDLQTSPLHTDEIFYPLGIDLVLYTYNFANALFGLPLLLGFNLTLASNITLLFAYISSGYGTYLLIRYLLGTSKDQADDLTLHLVAFLGGAIYAFSASRAIFAALGHYDIVSTNFIPFYTLYFLKTLREPSLKNPILTGLFATLCLLAEMIFGVFLLFLSLILIFYHRQPLQTQKLSSYIVDQTARANGLSLLEHSKPTFLHLQRIVLRLIPVTLVVLILWGSVMLPVLRTLAAGDNALVGWGESLKLSADLVGWFTPTDLHPLWGHDWVMRLRQVQEKTAPFSDVNTVSLGYGVLIFALLGIITMWRSVQIWLTSTIIFAVFTLGPLLQIKGQYLFSMDNLLREQGLAQDVTFPLPFMLLHYLPILNANRVPVRFAVVLSLALAILAAYGLFWLFSKIMSWPWINSLSAKIGLTIVLTNLLLFDQLALPMPLTRAEVPQVYAQIGAEADTFTLLQLPLGWRNSFGVFGVERTQIQYYQHIHQKPTLGGNISRAPAFKFDYYRQIPLFQAFAQTQLPAVDPAVDKETLNRARQQAAELMTLYNIRYVVIHPPIAGRKPYEDTHQQTRDLAFDLLPLALEPTYQADGVAAYRVQTPPVPNLLRLDFGDWTSQAYRGQGWSQDEYVEGASANWAVDSEAIIFFPRSTVAGLATLVMHLRPFSYPEAPPQILTLALNGQPINDYPLTEAWQILEATLPETHLQPGLNRLSLQFSRQAMPRQVLLADTAIGQTGQHVSQDIEVNSQADFAYITLGFGDTALDASTHRRGFNLAILEPNTGILLDKRGFDTAANHYEAQALHDYLAKIPPSQVVVVSSQGLDAGAFLGGILDEGFASLGGTAQEPLVPYSLIGVKGTSPGTAVEKFGEDAYIRLGRSPDIRPLAVAVDWVEIRSD